MVGESTSVLPNMFTRLLTLRSRVGLVEPQVSPDIYGYKKKIQCFHGCDSLKYFHFISFWYLSLYFFFGSF